MTDTPNTQQEHSSQHITLWQVLALALPALLVLASTPLYLLWDTFIVARLGVAELAALSAGVTILGTVTTQLTFLSYGTTAHTARHFGASRTSEAIFQGVQATWVALGVGIILSALIYFCAAPLVGIFSTDPAVRELAASWLRAASAAIIPALLVLAGNGWLRGVSNTRVPLYITLAGVLPMAGAVPLFVSRYGVVGSAYANVLGEWLMAAGFLGVLWRTWRTQGDGRSCAPAWSVIRQQLSTGRDLLLRSMSFQSAFISAAVVAGSAGSFSLGAHQILLQLWNFVSLVLDSVAIAAQALVGAALGAGAVGRARRVSAVVLRASVCCALVISTIFAVWSEEIPRLFSSDEQLLSTLSVPWWIFLVLILIGGVVFAYDGVLLGAGDSVFLRNLSIVSAVGGFLPIVWYSYYAGWGLPGVWCGLLVFVLVRCIACAWRVRGDKWTHQSENSQD